MFISRTSIKTLYNKFKEFRRHKEVEKVKEQLVEVNYRIPMIIEKDCEKFKNDLALKTLTKLNQGLLLFDNDYVRSHHDLVVGGLASSVVGIYGQGGNIFTKLKHCNDRMHGRITSFIESAWKTRLKKLYKEYPIMTMNETNIHDAFNTNSKVVDDEIEQFLEMPNVQDDLAAVRDKLYYNFKNQIKDSYEFIKNVEKKTDFEQDAKPSDRLVNLDSNKFFVPNKLEQKTTKILDTTPDISNYEALDKSIMELTVEESCEMFKRMK